MKRLVIAWIGLAMLGACSDLRGLNPFAPADPGAPLDAMAEADVAPLANTGVVAEVVTERSGGLGPLEGAATVPAGGDDMVRDPVDNGVVTPVRRTDAPVVSPQPVGGCDGNVFSGGAGYCVGN